MADQMVKVEQIRLLETKVQNAIKYIERLRGENTSLRESLGEYERRISDLEALVNDFKSGQEEIEKGIANALKQLDRLEDEVVDQPDSQPGSDSPGPADAQPTAGDNGGGPTVAQSHSPEDNANVGGTSPEPDSLGDSGAPRPQSNRRDTSGAQPNTALSGGARPHRAPEKHPETDTPFSGTVVETPLPEGPDPEVASAAKSSAGAAETESDEEEESTKSSDSELDIF